MSAQRIQWLRESWAFLKTKVYNQGQIVVDTTYNRLVVHDGGTVGGSAGPLRFTKSGLPTTTELTNDLDWGVFRDSSTGNLYVAVNSAGTIKKVQLT